MNLLDLCVKLFVDDSDVDKKFEKTGNQAEALAGKLKNGLAAAAKVGSLAVSAAATGISVLTKRSIESYGEYEQLVGGVETLFKQSADAVMGYAENAYKTAGMSANEYMTTVTAFSASLLQSMGGDTAAAAEKANLAITDMSDNANKMGTDMELIQNAYRGFAKSNYSMLDNLALGYGGTKEEMERLLADAEKLSGIKYDISSYSDIVDAIHVVQTEMGITGTTAKEASTTIQGSVAAMKSAWENLVTGVANGNADIDALIGNLVDSATTAAGNVLPRIEQILNGVGAAVSRFAPVLSEQVPQMLSATLPALLTSAISLTEGVLSGVVSVLPALLNTAVDAIPQLVGAASTIVSNLTGALKEAAPLILNSGMEVIGQLTTGIESGLPDMLSRLPQIITSFIDFCTENLPQIVEQGFDLLIALADGIIKAIPDLVAALPQVLASYLGYFTTMFPTVVKKGGELLGHLITGVLGAIPQIATKLPQVWKAVRDTFKAGYGEIRNAGRYLLEGLWNGISDKIAWLKSKVTGVVDTIQSWFTGKRGFDEHSPSKWANGVAKYVMQGMADGFENGLPSLMDSVGGITDRIKNGLDFGTASIDYSTSATGSLARAANRSNGDEMRPIVIDFTAQLDGKTLVRQMVPIMRNEVRSAGAAII